MQYGLWYTRRRGRWRRTEKKWENKYQESSTMNWVIAIVYSFVRVSTSNIYNWSLARCAVVLLVDSSVVRRAQVVTHQWFSMGKYWKKKNLLLCRRRHCHLSRCATSLARLPSHCCTMFCKNKNLRSNSTHARVFTAATDVSSMLIESFMMKIKFLSERFAIAGRLGECLCRGCSWQAF